MTIRSFGLLIKSKWLLIVIGTFILNVEKCSAAPKVQRHADFTTATQPVVCQTPACREIAQLMLQNMDPSVSPCENFYRFACGNFSRNAAIADDWPMVSQPRILQDRVQKQLWDSIEFQITNSDPKSFKLLAQLYQTCLNEEQTEKYGKKEFLEIVDNLGGWPVLMGKSWDEAKSDWQEMIYKFRDVGYSFNLFFSVGTMKDMKDNDKRRVYLDQPSFGFSREYLVQGLNQKVVKSYLQYMIDFAKALGVNSEQANRELEETLKFAIELAKIALPASKRRNTTQLYNPKTVEQLQLLYPDIPWRSYLNRLLGPQVGLSSSDVVIVVVPSFFDGLVGLLSRASPRVLANYAFWRLSQETVNQLGEDVRRLQRSFTAVLTGKSAPSPRWQECVKLVDQRVPLATGALYVRRQFDRTSKKEASEIIENVRKSLRGMLEKVTWLDELTRKAALEKLAAMLPFIAYPDEFLDNQKLDDYYKNLQVYPDSFIKTTLSLNLFELAHKLDRFNKPVDKTDWTNYIGSAVVNAFYNSGENIMQLPAGILQGFFFNKDHPQYMNYAGIGMLVGHEMTHGFDDQGRMFDKNGKLHDWWTANVTQEYLSRAQCTVHQYGNYTVQEIGSNLDGVKSQGENIADNGGLKEAYLAYEVVERERGPEPLLSGLESYTPRQLFWLSNANIWCEKHRPEYLRNVVTVDSHTPGEYRVIGPMSNMPEFARDFECPLGSPMNPVDKCTFW